MPMDWQGYQALPAQVAGDQNFVSSSATSTTLITADAICSANLSVAGDRHAPAAILLHRAPQSLRILAAGTLPNLAHHPATDSARRIDRPGCILLPALVNAHTHLDLTHIGPQPHDPGVGFVPWIDMVRARRHTEPDLIRASVEAGIHLLRKGGVSIVGDIAGAPAGHPSLIPWQTLAQSGLAGVSYLEFFALGARADASLARLDALIDSLPALTQSRVRLGLQPHAPNTVAPSAYEHACLHAQRLALPLITHLAESPEERQFIAHATGPQLELLQSLGIWTPEAARDFGQGQTPVEHMAGILHLFPLHAVHLNQCSDTDLALLAAAGTRVVYCPRASDYFGATIHFGPHRYQDMLAAGIEVALGTDSLINLPSGVLDQAGLGLSTLDEARYLHDRDATNPDTLIRMMTTHGCRLLGLDDARASLHEGATPAGILAVPAPAGPSPAKQLMLSTSPPEFLCDENSSRHAGVGERP